MNNNLYQWHDEQLVRHEMQELSHAVAQDRLLREAGLATSNLLTHDAPALGKLLASRSEWKKLNRYGEQQPY
jgi:hypothetical protein